MKTPLSFLRKASLLTGITLVFSAGTASAITKTYRYYSFQPTKLRGAGNSCQMSEFQFLSGGTPVPVTNLTVTNPTGNNPAAEAPANLKDLNLDTKWLDFNKTTPVIFDFGADTTVDSYNWATANDASERDPVDWIVSGSADGTNWTPIDIRKSYTTDPGRKVWQAAAFALPANIDPLVSSFTSSSYDVLNGGSIDLTWAVTLADTVTISGISGTLPLSGTQTLTPPNNANTTYTLTATNNTTHVSTTSSITVRTVAGGTSTYQYVRFTPVKLRDNTTAIVQLADIAFVSQGLIVNATAATNPGGTNAVDANEGALKAIDGISSSKWLDGNRKPLIVDFGTPSAFDAYFFVTGNDAPERDPVRWTLEGSNDNVNWTLIEDMTQFDYGTPTARNAVTPDLPLPGATNLSAPVTSFTTEAPTVLAGQPAILSWTTLGADTVTIDHGVGTVAGNGSVSVSPSATTTYTITATKNGINSTAQLTITVVNTTNTSIAYANFDNAGGEIITLRDASIVLDNTRTVPSGVKRLRVNTDNGSRVGAAWYAKRMNLGQGFDTTFDLSMITLAANNPGADGATFVIQNVGNSTYPTANEDKGFTSKCVAVTFDSYINTPDPTAATVQILINGVQNKLINLPVDAPTVLGSGVTDLTQTTAGATPYHIRITYGAGLMNIYMNNVQILTDYAVDISGALDANGKAYVGFLGRTGGFYEAHDITAWSLTEGAPAGATVPLALTASTINRTAGTVALTWTSNAGKTYRITSSSDLVDWTTVLQSGIASGGATTSTTVNFTPSAKGFFRVEQE